MVFIHFSPHCCIKGYLLLYALHQLQLFLAIIWDKFNRISNIWDFQKGCSSHIEPFYKTEKLDLQNRNGRGLYSQDKEIKYKELCDLSPLWGAAGKEIKLLKSSDLDINSIFSQWWNVMNNEEYVKHRSLSEKIQEL